MYLGEHRGERTVEEIENSHHSYLHAVKATKEEAEASIIYSYKNVINGFSASLAPEEARRISGGVITYKLNGIGFGLMMMVVLMRLVCFLLSRDGWGDFSVP